MTGRLLILRNTLSLNSNLGWFKFAIILATTTIPLVSQAKLSGFGDLILDSTPTDGIASGRYTTSNGAEGKFVIKREAFIGYSGENIQGTTNGVKNGVQIQNRQKVGTLNDDKDTFSYEFIITPDPKYNSFIHTIKIAQASYATSGNSEIARQTLSYTDFDSSHFGPKAKAIVEANPSVSYFYDAMGDYFLGQKVSETVLQENSPIIGQSSGQQLREDDSTSDPLYYYNITRLDGSGNASSYTPVKNNAGEVTRRTLSGTLPPNPTFANILKYISKPNTYKPLSVGHTIGNGGSYVSYGIENAVSEYIISVKNAKTVTLKYEGIMHGNIAVNAQVVGETYNEWISFGVESEAAPTYTFSGTVFNDNGGLILEANKLGTVNSQYFNGIFDPLSGEVGISNPNLAVRLTDCSAKNTLIPTTLPQAITDTGIKKGQYNFSVSSSALQNKTKVCIVQVEPENWEYSVDSTTNKREVALNTGVYNYNNLDFGEVQANNASLVLVKSQYVNNCDINVNYNGTNGTPSQTPIFSTDSITNIEPGKCIAYRIEAYNRGHVDLKDVQISDKLQTKAQGGLVNSVFALPVPKGDPASLYTGTTLPTGTIISEPFKLDKPTGTVPTKATLYFNTKYGTTVDP
ncbi:hypothetical protein [Psychrobacter maritimus]|uniref:hypothetical protein n=1 Tax=Psychrobacter maritimus TaxID=256325 RepID=UPI00356A0773